MVRTDSRRTATHRLLSAGVLSAALAAAAPALAAAPPGHPQANNPFGPGVEPVAEAKLAKMRGGFETPSGETINVGIAVTGRVTGPDVPDFQFTVGQRITDSVENIASATSLADNGPSLSFSNGTLTVDGGAGSGGVTVQAAADASNALKTLLQAGQGNTAPDLGDIGAEGLANVIQNNLNNINIDLTNQIDLDTSMNLGSDLANRVTDAVRAVQTGGF